MKTRERGALARAPVAAPTAAIAIGTAPAVLAQPLSDDNVVRGIALAVTLAVLGVAVRLLRRGTRLTLSRSPRPRSGGSRRTPAAGEVGRPAAGAPSDHRTRHGSPDRGGGPPPVPRPTAGARHTHVPTALSLAPGLPALRADVMAAGERMTVRLTGERGRRDTPGYGWARPGETTPRGSAAVTVGEGRDGELWLDLVSCPDVLTVTGPLAACLRQVRGWAVQLAAAGVPVAIVMNVAQPAVPPGCRAVRTLARLLEEPPVGHDIEVVFCAAHDAADPIVRERLLGHTRPRWVPVLVGDVRRSRWSVAVAAGAPRRTRRDP